MNDKPSQVVDINDKYLYSLSQLSTVFGPARETISKRLRAADVVPTSERGGHNVYHIRAAAKAILTGEESTFEEITDPEKLPPMARLNYYKSENERRKFELDSGLLVTVEAATSEMAGIVKVCIRTLDLIPDMLEMKCGLSVDEIQLVESECDKAREDLATELEK